MSDVIQLDMFRPTGPPLDAGESADSDAAAASERRSCSPASTSWPNREQHPSVRVDDPDTCVEPPEFRMSNGRMKALGAHYMCRSGLTDFELADATDTPQTSIGKRRGECAHAGLIIATTERRPSPTGSPAIVWRITPAGVELIRQLNEAEA